MLLLLLEPPWPAKLGKHRAWFLLLASGTSGGPQGPSGFSENTHEERTRAQSWTHICFQQRWHQFEESVKSMSSMYKSSHPEQCFIDKNSFTSGILDMKNARLVYTTRSNQSMKNHAFVFDSLWLWFDHLSSRTACTPQLNGLKNISLDWRTSNISLDFVQTLIVLRKRSWTATILILTVQLK